MADESESPACKRQRVEEEPRMAIRRKKLETRYVSRKFYDGDTKETRTVQSIAYDAEDAVWMALTEDDVPYYLNAASKMDDMIAAQREREQATPPENKDTVIEVLWSVADDSASGEEEEKVVWWRAEIGEKVASHTLRDGGDVVELDVFQVTYAARPELGEPEPATHRVCFLSQRALLDVTSEEEVMQWRAFGATDEPVEDLTAELEQPEETDASTDFTSVDEIINATLAQAMEGRVKQKFDQLARASQCAVADRIVDAKAKMKAAFQAHMDRKRRDGDADAHGRVTLTPDDVATVLESLKAQVHGTSSATAPIAPSTSGEPAM